MVNCNTVKFVHSRRSALNTTYSFTIEALNDIYITLPSVMGTLLLRKLSLLRPFCLLTNVVSKEHGELQHGQMRS